MVKANLDGKYPCCPEWITFQKKGNAVIAKNQILDEEVELTRREAEYLIKLNGNRNPYKIRGYSYTEGKQLFEYFDEMMMIRKEGRVISLGIEKLYTLYVPSKQKTTSLIPKILNVLLMALFIPVVIMGIRRLAEPGIYTSEGGMIFGSIFGLALGSCLHEAAHATACLSDTNGRFFEAGVMWSGFFPGAYVLMDTSGIKSRLKRVQVYMAGAEMNLLLSGLLFILAYQNYSPTSFMYSISGALGYAAFQNAFMGFINLLFTDGLDGSKGIMDLLGWESMDDIKEVLSGIISGNALSYIRRDGMSAVIRIIVCLIMFICQLALPLLILTDIILIFT